jgi:hypothetical protein
LLGQHAGHSYDGSITGDGSLNHIGKDIDHGFIEAELRRFSDEVGKKLISVCLLWVLAHEQSIGKSQVNDIRHLWEIALTVYLRCRFVTERARRC